MRTTIYGIFKDETCLYVGRTDYPEQRFAHHRRLNPDCTLRVLQLANDPSSAESKWIRKYKKIGQAQRNYSWGRSNVTIPVFISRSTHRLLKLAATKAQKPLFQLCDEIVLRAVKRQPKNGEKR